MATQKVDIASLETGDYLSVTQYYKVVKNNPKNKLISLLNAREEEIYIDKDIIADFMYSAGQYKVEKTLSRSEISLIFEEAGETVFSVNFNKQAKDQDIKEKLLTIIRDEEGNFLIPEQIEANLKKISKGITKGDERTIIGYLVKTESKMGRSTVIDLEIPPDQHRLRQVDHRTINWLILKNVKYVVK